jgi:hypothetical protein
MPHFYLLWIKNRQRCSNPVNKLFYRFGGKGLKMCKRWNEYSKFAEDMLPSYKKALKKYGKGNFFFTRKNDLKDFCKENCYFLNKEKYLINLGKRRAWKTVFYAGEIWSINRMDKKFGKKVGKRLLRGIPEKYLFNKILPFSVRHHAAKTSDIHNFYLKNINKFNELKKQEAKVMSYLFGGEMKSGYDASKKFKLSSQRIYQIRENAIKKVSEKIKNL